MVVLIVNQHDILPDKHKRQSPVTVDPNRPVTIQATRQRVMPPTGNVHLHWRGRLVLSCQLTIEFFSVMRLDASHTAFLKKRLQPFVLECFDHFDSVSLSDTRRKSANQ